ncbi:MAG: HNH endonuclease signature motif containing protein [Patescibacteria group bacterium]
MGKKLSSYCKRCKQEKERKYFREDRDGFLIERICRNCLGEEMKKRELVPYKKYKKKFCERCGFRGQPCQLDVNHIDGNHGNNKLKNLETLCSNCHRLETYRQLLDRVKNKEK